MSCAKMKLRTRPQKQGPNVGLIAGATVGSVLGAALLAFCVWFFLIRSKGKGSAGREAWYSEEEELKRTNSDIALTPQGSTLVRRPTGTFNLQQVEFRQESLEPMAQNQLAELPTYNEAFNRIQRPPGVAREVEGTQ